MRLFVCSFLGDDAQEFYRRHFAEPIAASGGLLRSIPPGSAHITHVFMGDVPDASLASIADAVATVAGRHDAIVIRLGAPEIQYARAEARLVYAPLIEGAAAISKLTGDIAGELTRVVGLGRVDGSRSPHVTLARFRKQTHRRSALPLLDTLTRNRVGDVVLVDRIAEVQIAASELTPAGPRYDVKARLALT
jgi:RNA 2',3'-cyclic 3'-phosphodiesterase